MSLPTYQEAAESAREGSAFSNNSQWDIWSGNWCDRCINDSPEKVDRGEGCPLIAVSLFEQKTPAAWMEPEDRSAGDRYHCIYFRDEDEGPDPEPTPIPDPPGQLTLIPREPNEQTRMLTTFPTQLGVALNAS